MDASRFDTLAKGMAATPSRRGLLGMLVAGSLFSAFGHKRSSFAANGQTCTLDFAAFVRLGPSAGTVVGNGSTQPGELRGELSFAVEEDGDVSDGQLTLSDGPVLPIVGRQVGRTVELRIDVGVGQALVAIGVGAETIAACRGAVDGLLTGPELGDLGDWHATALGLTGVAAGGGSSGGSTSTSTGGGSAAATQTAAARATSTAAATATVGPTPTTDCPAGEVPCGSFCRDVMNDDFHCGRCDNPCPSPTHYCEGGVCVEAACPGGQTNCAGYCADLLTSTIHCGACGNACGANAVCYLGVCGCEAPFVLAGGRCCLSNAQGCTADGQCCSGFCDENSMMTCRERPA